MSDHFGTLCIKDLNNSGWLSCKDGNNLCDYLQNFLFCFSNQSSMALVPYKPLEEILLGKVEDESSSVSFF